MSILFIPITIVLLNNYLETNQEHILFTMIMFSLLSVVTLFNDIKELYSNLIHGTEY